MRLTENLIPAGVAGKNFVRCWSIMKIPSNRGAVCEVKSAGTNAAAYRLHWPWARPVVDIYGLLSRNTDERRTLCMFSAFLQDFEARRHKEFVVQLRYKVFRSSQTFITDFVFTLLPHVCFSLSSDRISIITGLSPKVFCLPRLDSTFAQVSV